MDLVDFGGGGWWLGHVSPCRSGVEGGRSWVRCPGGLDERGSWLGWVLGWRGFGDGSQGRVKGDIIFTGISTRTRAVEGVGVDAGVAGVVGVVGVAAAAAAAVVQVGFRKRRAGAFGVHPGAPVTPDPPVAAVDATVGLLLDSHSIKEVLLGGLLHSGLDGVEDLPSSGARPMDLIWLQVFLLPFDAGEGDPLRL